MRTAETQRAHTGLESSARPPDAPTAGWTLGRLSAGARLALLAALLATLAAAAAGLWLAGAPAARASIAILALLAFGLEAALARQLTAETARRSALREGAQRHARDLERQVESRTRELSALSTHLQELSEREKSQLARNLHDELGGLLTAAKMDLSWLQSRAPPGAFQERLTQLGAVLDEAMDLKRSVVDELRPSLLDHFGLPTALRAYAESTCAKAGLDSELQLSEESVPMPKEAAIALFRVGQEGLTNIIRHARARTIRLSFTGEADVYRFVLSDDGCGFNAADPQFRWSHGLMGMRQRVRSLGGTIEIDSAPGAGTTLRVTVPRSA
jgi:signal transduction histidine kinase